MYTVRLLQVWKKERESPFLSGHSVWTSRYCHSNNQQEIWTFFAPQFLLGIILERFLYVWPIFDLLGPIGSVIYRLLLDTPTKKPLIWSRTSLWSRKKLTRKFPTIRDADQERPSVHLLMPLSSSLKINIAPLRIMVRRSRSLSRRVMRGTTPCRAAWINRRASPVLSIKP